ncbi:hypothetical protein PTKIN_Ptkin04bG0187900 [Pterospermum kingtungense]
MAICSYHVLGWHSSFEFVYIEFKRNEDNDLDSSRDDSKSSNASLLKKNKLVPSLISVGDDETSRLKQQDNDNPSIWGQINMGKAKKRKTKDSLEEVDIQKGETSAYDLAPLDELKNFMDSLLKDLKVTRENLLKWMMEELQELVADDTTPPKPKGINMIFSKNVRYHEGNNAVNSTDYFNALGDTVDSGQVTELIMSPNLQTSCAKQNDPVQGHKSVVLAIEAEKGKKIDNYQEPEDQDGDGQGQVTRTIAADTNEENLGSLLI